MCDDLTIESNDVMACMKAVGCNGGTDQGSCKTTEAVPTIWLQQCVGGLKPPRVTCGACALAKSKSNMCNMISSVQAIDTKNTSLVTLDALSMMAGLSGMYGKYELQQPPSLAVRKEENSNVCRSVSVSDMTTRWRGAGTIEVTHRGDRFLHEMSNADTNFDGWQRTPEGLCRRALGALKVTEFKASNASASWTLVAAHRINYRYASKWSDNWLDSKELARLQERGIATGALYDSVGLVWFLLMKNGTNFAMCTGYLPAYFADRVYGNLPVPYNICTATRHQATCEDKRSWLFDTDTSFPCPTATHSYEETIADKIKPAKWIADKFAEPIVPFFKDTSGAVTEVVAAAIKSNIGAPLGTLIDDMRYAYFGIVGASGPGASGAGANGASSSTGGGGTAGASANGTNGPSASGTKGPSASVTKGPSAIDGKGLEPWAIALIVGVCLFIVVAVGLLIWRYQNSATEGRGWYDSGW